MNPGIAGGWRVICYGGSMPNLVRRYLHECPEDRELEALMDEHGHDITIKVVPPLELERAILVDKPAGS